NNEISAIDYSLRRMGDVPIRKIPTKPLVDFKDESLKTIEGLNTKIKELRSNLGKEGLSMEEFKQTDAAIKTLTTRLRELNEAEDAKNAGKGGKGEGKPNEDKKAEREAAQQQRIEKQAKEHFARLLKEEELFSAQQLIEQKEKNDKEVAQLELDYQKKIDKFEEFKTKEGASKKDKAAADDQIAKLEVERDAAVAALKLKQEQDLVDNIAKVRQDLSNRTENERTREINRINQHFDQLKKDVGTNEAQLALIEEGRAKALTDAKIREEERLAKVKKALDDETEAYSTDKWQQKINEVQQRYAREIELLKERNSKEIQETEAFKEILKAMET